MTTIYVLPWYKCTYLKWHMVRSYNVFPHPDERPRITVHPQDLKNIVPSKPLTFAVQATGTEPLSYQWEIKTRNGKGGWQLCDVESFPGANSSTLTIPSVQKSNEGSYRCTVSNCAGSETSQCATLTVGKEIRFICALAVLAVQHTARSFSLRCL